MIDLIKPYESMSPKWAAASLEEFLRKSSSGLVSSTSIGKFEEVKDYQSYNHSLLYMYQELSAAFYQAREIENLQEKSSRLASDQLLRIRQAIEDLEGRLSYVFRTSQVRETHTDTVFETFNGQSSVETDKKFYANGSIPQVFIDKVDNRAKLPLVSELTVSRTPANEAAPRCSVDRFLGISVGENSTIDKAFDSRTNEYWVEKIRSKSPIFANKESYPWLPSSYEGGAVCRVRADLERVSSISEVRVNPFGEHPLSILSVGVVSTVAASGDPLFSTYGGPDSQWSMHAVDFGVINLALAGSVTDGVLSFSTETSTQRSYIESALIDVGPTVALDVRFQGKVLGNMPLFVEVISYDASGNSLDEAERSAIIESEGWSEIRLAFDVPPNTTKVKLRIGIPANFERVTTIWIKNPEVRRIYTTAYTDKFVSSGIQILDNPEVTDAILITFAQPHGDLVSVVPPSIDEMGLRTSRQITRPSTIVDWSDAGRLYADQFFGSRPTTTDVAPRVLQEVSQSITDQLTRPKSEKKPELFYEYIIGAYNLDLVYTEHVVQARYVGTPIKVDGEIREIRLIANDEHISPDDIEYTVTLNESDPPETGKRIQNVISGVEVETGASLSGLLNISSVTWTSGASFIPVSGSTLFTAGDPYITRLLENSAWFEITRGVSGGTEVYCNLGITADLSSARGLLFDYFLVYLPGANTPSAGTGVFSISVSEGASNQTSSTFTGYAREFHIGSQQTQFSTALLSLADVPILNRNMISRITLSYVGGGLQWQPAGAKTYLVIRNVRYAGSSAAGRVIRFLPSEESEATSAGDFDFVVPTRTIQDILDGTDSGGRAFTTNYPYVNMETVRSISSQMSAYTGGRQVPFDPNALTVKVLSSPSTVSTITGYRPVAVTLSFRDQNLRAVPDSIGKPKPGDTGYSGDETMEIAALSQKIITIEQEAPLSDLERIMDTSTRIKLRGSDTAITNILNKGKKDSSKSRTITTEISVLYYQTKQKKLISSVYGTPIKVWWKMKDTPFTLQAIDSSKLRVDAESGLIEILENPPTNFEQVVCNYYYSLGEDSLREYYGFNDISATGDAAQTNVQPYPVTRNMTDYMTGATPTLKPPVLDQTSPDYYPVFEYYVHPKGYLVFAVNMHKYSDTPSDITVEYSTLGISPRLSIELRNLSNPSRTSYTPRIDDFTLLMNVRR